MRVLLTNDDGVLAPGLRAMAEALEALAELWVVAPDRERSAVARAITLHSPLRIQELGERRWAVDGTPTDCVYVGVVHLMAGARPDLVISGVNPGPNLGTDVMYSGTAGAAMEGCHLGVASLAVSTLGRTEEDLRGAARFGAALAEQVAARGLPERVLLNVNVPVGCPADGPWRLTSLGRRNYRREVVARTDPRGRRYYWIGGPPVQDDDIPGSDCNVVAEGAISVSPVHLELTHRESLDALAAWTVAGRRAEA